MRDHVDGDDTRSCTPFAIPIPMLCSIYLRYVEASVEKTSWYIRHIREYFEEKWVDTEKPFEYTDKQMKKLGLTSPESAKSQALRSVRSLKQPLVLEENVFS